MLERQINEKHWDANHARALSRECADCGLSTAEFCRQKKIDPRKLYSWKSRLQNEPAPLFTPALCPPSRQPPFIEAIIKPSLTSEIKVTIRCPNGYHVDLTAPSFSIDWLVDLSRALGHEEGR